VRLGAACITGVERVFREDDHICFTRAVYNGKIMAIINPVAAPMVVTVQPGIFKPPRLDHTTPGTVDIRTVSLPPQRTRSKGIKRAKQEDSALSEAEVIVSAGRGIGSKKNLDLISRLAALFPRSAVGGSRPVCDLDWLEYKQQVGITGATVTPTLYIACGISGSVQHQSGMRGAGFIVAINTDPDAAIFNIADVCIVEDLTTFIPSFIEEYEDRKRTA
jgi:electron transfer flavoprotein alpha subunit